MGVYTDTSADIGAFFDTQIATPQSLPTFYPNQVVIPPSGDSMDQLWARLNIIWSTQRSEIVQGAKGRFRTRGELIVSVHGPADKGTGPSSPIIDTIVETFRGATVAGDVHFEAAEVRRAGTSGHWWQTNIHCPFYVDEVT